MAYDNRIEEFNQNDAKNYERFIDGINARANTDFAIVFQKIQDLVSYSKGLESLTVIFFTDGCDTVN